MSRNDFDPRTAQRQSVFTELSALRKAKEAAEKRAQQLQGAIDAKAAGLTVQMYEGVRTTLRDLLVAVENQYLSTKDDKRKIPKELNAAMKAAQKVVRPNTPKSVPVSTNADGHDI